DATKQLDEVEKLDSKSQDLARLRIALLQKQDKTGDAKTAFTHLPEGTRQERLSKARVAQALGNNADAERLYDLVRQQNPADLEAIALLAQLYANDNKRDQAEQVIADALKANPGNPRLQNM